MLLELLDAAARHLLGSANGLQINADSSSDPPVRFGPPGGGQVTPSTDIGNPEMSVLEMNHGHELILRVLEPVEDLLRDDAHDPPLVCVAFTSEQVLVRQAAVEERGHVHSVSFPISCPCPCRCSCNWCWC